MWLFPDAEVTVDAVRFEQLARVAVREGDPVAARDALAWYRGELLPGDRYEEWAADRREMLHLRHLDVLRVAGEWRELVELDPTDEEAHVELMRRHLDAGDGAAAAARVRAPRTGARTAGRAGRLGSARSLRRARRLVNRQRARCSPSSTPSASAGRRWCTWRSRRMTPDDLDTVRPLLVGAPRPAGADSSPS